MKKLVLVLFVALVAMSLSAQTIQLGNFPVGSWLDHNYNAIWEFSSNNIRILNTYGNVVHSFSNYTIQDFRVFMEGTQPGISFTCPDTGRSYRFLKPLSGTDLVMEIERNARPAYSVTMRQWTGEFVQQPVVESGYDGPPPGYYGDRNCFAAGTSILMADGSLKTIESIKAGDVVQSYNFETNERVVSTVTQLISVSHANLVKLTLAGGVEIVTTTDHPFCIERTVWTAAASNQSPMNGVWAAVNAARANSLYHQETEVAELTIGAKVFMPQHNTYQEIVGIENVPAMQMTYTIELSDNDNFIANRMLVKTEDVR